VTDAERALVYDTVETLNYESSWPRGLEETCALVRDLVASFVRDPVALRADVRAKVPQLLHDVLGLKARGGRREAAVTFAFDRRGFRLDAVPVLDAVPEKLVYGLALLLDSRRDFGRGLRQCTAPARPRATGEAWNAVPRCGRFFWRRYLRQRYCQPRCTRLGTREVNTRRMQRHRAPRGKDER